MTATLRPSFVAPLRALFTPTPPASPLQDLTEPAHCPDAMGTVCRLHDCARFLGEAPLVPRDEEADDRFDLIKQRHFPNSWTAIASCERPGLFKRTGRTRLVVVRYCPECREAAQSFLNATSEKSVTAKKAA